jgi:hypothetical protein
VKKYIFCFFVFLTLFLICSIILAFILNIQKPTDYYIDLIIVAMSSIVAGFVFVKNNGRAPAQKESMIYLVWIVTILIIASVAFTGYRLKPFIDSGEIELTASFVNNTIGFLLYPSKYILTVYPPFYFTCKLLDRKYK